MKAADVPASTAVSTVKGNLRERERERTVKAADVPASTSVSTVKGNEREREREKEQ